MDSVGRIIGEIGADADSGRARQRDSLFMTAQLRLDGDANVREVRVRNLSPGGLMIEFDRAVTPGAAVTLEMRGIGEVTGAVAWATRGRVGIALDAPIDPKRARKTIGGGGGSTPTYAKPLVVRSPRR